MIRVVRVVAAIVERDGRFLLTRRQRGTHLEGLWEFPGGKIDGGETDGQALVREMREELDVEAVVGELELQTTHAYPERTVALFFYRCTLRGEPRPVLGQQMRWVTREELETLGLPPADDELVRRLLDRQQR
jgi:8-oxo-dGTP diphosphatase